MTVYVLVLEGYEDCVHHGVWHTLGGAKSYAQRLDDEYAVEGESITHVTLKWDDDYPGPSHKAEGCGWGRWWRIWPEEVRHG